MTLQLVFIARRKGELQKLPLFYYLCPVTFKTLRKQHYEVCGQPGGCTDLLPFEQHLLNIGFESHKFGCLNAACPNRSYVRDGFIIYIGFGLEVVNGGKVNFYFQIGGDSRFFQVNNDIEKFEDAINGKLEPIFAGC